MAQPFAEPCGRGLIAAEPCPRELGREIDPARRRMVLAACVLASSMAFIDGSALTVALPRLRADLGTDLASVQWVVNGYVLSLASLTLIGGALADAYGRRGCLFRDASCSERLPQLVRLRHPPAGSLLPASFKAWRLLSSLPPVSPLSRQPTPGANAIERLEFGLRRLRPRPQSVLSSAAG